MRTLHYQLSPGARAALEQYIPAPRSQSHFANARSIRNALDLARLRQANRLLAVDGPVTAERLSTIEAEATRASRVFMSAAERET